MEISHRSISHYLPDTEHFYDLSRVWIYQADREFTEEEIKELDSRLLRFTTSWTSHRVKVKAAADLLYNRFLVFMVDDSYTGVGGCSIDSLLKEVQQIQKDYNVNLLDRLQLAVLENEEVKVYHKDDLIDKLKDKELDESTLLFDNLVSNKKEFETEWLKPIKESWLSRMI